jgi:hypothetical protein
MKFIGILISGFFVLTIAFIATADEIKTVNIGDAVVVYNYQSAGDNGVTLTLNALVSETNGSLRGLKNTDQRRLRKLGELIYQCKLLLYRSNKNDRSIDVDAPTLISRNYSLFTGVDLSLTADERVSIQAQALQTVDEASLFTPTLGNKDIHRKIWGNVGEGVAINLKQLNVNVLTEGGVIQSAENMDIIIRFPIFQMEKPVHQWSYNFNLKDFKQAVQHADENCTPAKFIELINQTTIGANIQPSHSS